MDHRVVFVRHVDVASDVAQRDRRVFAPRNIGDVVDRVTAPSEVVEVGIQLVEERPALVGLAQLLGQITRMVLVEQQMQRRTVVNDSTEPPEAVCGIDRTGVMALQDLVRLRGIVGLHDLGVEVAQLHPRHQREVDVTVDVPHLGHPTLHVVELGEQFGVAQARVVGIAFGLIGNHSLVQRLPTRGTFLSSVSR